jgi:hypothetical protein
VAVFIANDNARDASANNDFIGMGVRLPRLIWITKNRVQFQSVVVPHDLEKPNSGLAVALERVRGNRKVGCVALTVRSASKNARGSSGPDDFLM